MQEVGASPAVMSYEGGKDYARGTNFSCMATSGEGYVVVGSKDGKLRLYNNKSLTQVGAWRTADTRVVLLDVLEVFMF